jgi:choice-of-anchor B domain-containing protein
MRAIPPLLLVFLALFCAGPVLAQSGSFGNSVVITEGEMIIGEPTTNFRPGSVYVYRLQDGTWREADRIQAPEPARADGFGTLVALGGETLFVGQREGPIHTFQREGDRWQHSGTVAETDGLGIQRPEDDDGEWGEVQTIPLGCNQYGYCETDFGLSLAADGDWLLVGEPGQEADAGDGGHQAPVMGAAEAGAGVVHVFRRGGGGWTLHSHLQASDAAEGDLFGRSIVLQDGRALVAAPQRDAEGGTPLERAGQLYEFVLEGDAWVETGVVQAGHEANAQLGSALAMSGDRAVVGAPGADEGQGAIIVLQRDGANGAWSEAFRLSPPAGEPGDRFGHSVGLAGHDIWVGAPTPRDLETGRVYVFPADPAGPPPSASDARRIELEDSVEEDAFGSRIFTGSGVVAVTALGMHHGAGSVHAYHLDDAQGWVDRGMLVSPADAHEAIVGEERRCPEEGGGQIGPFECDDVDLVAFVPNSMLAPSGRERGVRLNDNWGWTDPETGIEYALVGRNDGLAILDMSDPSSPVLVGDLPKTPNTPRSQLWRDMKTYKDHVFVVADGAGNHGLQILDLRQIREIDPADMPVTFEPDYHYDNVASVHNININEETGLAALVGARGGGETCGGGLHMLDVRDPLNPQFLGCHLDENATHDVQCATYRGPDQDYYGRELCLKANATFLSISDVTDWDSPVVVGRATYPNPGYLHQGWLTEDHRYFIMDDEADVIQGQVETTRTLIFDVSNVEDPILAEEFFGSFPASAHNLYVKGDYAFQANYRYGLHVLDVSDPENPAEVGFFNTTPYLSGPGFSGAWSTFPYFDSGLVLVTSVQDGMFLLRPRLREGVVFEEE